MAFGIDLGTTNSCVARIDEAGKPAIVKSALSEDTTPSVVYFESPKSAIVGRAAKDEALVAPELVAQHVKRDMGTGATYTFHGEKHTPETVSALILRELARATEENTGQVMRDVVITVPAYFAVAEREATRKAGQIGLNVLDVLAEPVAAAMHYQAVTGKVVGVRHILVYDLGGGTFDTTVIRLDGDGIRVICTGGDPRLGGADWDEALTSYLLDQFTAEHPGSAPQEDPSFMQDLRISAEQLKQALSTVKSRRHIMRFGGAVTHVELTRDKLEEIAAGLLDRTMAATERTIAEAQGKGVTTFDDVLLVGGMSRMPAVTRVLASRLGLTARHHDPDFAVAKGAALYAMSRAKQDTGPAAASAMLSPEVEAIAGKRVTTVVSRGFGVMTLDGRDPLALTDPLRARKMIAHLLTANTELPADTGPYTFQTAMDNQRIVAIEVWEQNGDVESEELADNHKIGQGLLKNLPPRLPAQTPIEVTFFMSETGLLTVQATQPGSDANLQFDLQIGDLDKAGMDKARQSVARYTLRG